MASKTKASKRPTSFIGFHVSLDDGRVRGGAGTKVGTTYRTAGPVKMCKSGLHASPTLEAAARYRFLGEGRIVSLVQLFGEMRSDRDKVVAKNRKVLATYRLPYLAKGRCNKIHLGHTGRCEIDTIPQKTFDSIEKRLLDSYKKNKKRIDAMDQVVTVR